MANVVAAEPDGESDHDRFRKQEVSRYPAWIRSWFVVGASLFLLCTLALLLTPILGTSSSVVVLYFGSTIGAGIVWFVTGRAGRYHLVRR